MVLLESFVLDVVVPESEQEIIAVAKSKVAAKDKIDLRIIVFGFDE